MRRNYNELCAIGIHRECEKQTHYITIQRTLDSDTVAPKDSERNSLDLDFRLRFLMGSCH